MPCRALAPGPPAACSTPAGSSAARWPSPSSALCSPRRPASCTACAPACSSPRPSPSPPRPRACCSPPGHRLRDRPERHSTHPIDDKDTDMDMDKDTDMADDNEPSGAQQAFGDFAPAFVGFTDDVLFGQVWPRPQLSPKERSLITVAALTTGGNTEQLRYHLQFAKDNGASEEELVEAITHLAFYAGWPKAFSAMAVAQQVFGRG